MVIAVGSRERALNVWASVAVGLTCLACAPPDVVEIEGRRIVSAASRPVMTGLSTAQRFGARAPETQESPLSWTLPPGWQELQASGMRLANLRPDSIQPRRWGLVAYRSYTRTAPLKARV